MAQYGPCGCQTECPCVLVGGKGIEVTGTGNVDDPYVISTDGTIDCGLTMGCVCAKIVGNTGIRCNPSQGIELFLSGDGGNGMKFGQDGGLYASCPNCMDNPNNCVRSVDDLDAKIAAKQFLWGTYQGGRLLVPWGTMRAVDHAVAIMSDLDVNWVSTLRGCGAAIHPYPRFCNGSQGQGWSAHYNYATANAGFCQSIDYYRLNPAQWMNFTKYVKDYYDAGWDDRPADGGRLLSQIFGRVDRKLIHAWFVTAVNQYPEIINTIQYWCAQRQSIIFHWAPDRIPEAVGAGIPAGIVCFTAPPRGANDDPWIGTWTPELAAQAKAAGADWAAVSMRLTDAQIQTFPAAGLKTFGFDTFRRVDVMRAVNLGLIGLLSDDMVYQRYEEALNPIPGFIQNPNRNCFTPIERTNWGVGSAGHGQVFPPEYPDSFRSRRGYFRNATAPTNPVFGTQLPCWHLPSNFGDYDASSEVTDNIPAMGVGDISNHPYLSNPTGYRISWYAGWVTDSQSLWSTYPSVVGNPPRTPTVITSKFGLFFAAPDDRNITGANAYRNKGPQKAAQGYFVFIRPTNRQLVIAMRSADSGDATSGYSTLGTPSAPGALMPGNELWQFHVDVTPGSAGASSGTITFWTDGGPNSGNYQITVTSADAAKFRGGYVFIAKEELDGGMFEARFAEVNIDLLTAAGQPMGEPQPLYSNGGG
ncbi:hypothetical protein AB0O47_38850 [Streptomyces noursei]|uniref:hypothetical protein n=1 Tax=Streptomyces noursei TaxID=1971 RepID=UPI0034505390